MPYWRLSGFYFFYFASLGILVPYWPLYLDSLEFTPIELGNMLAILMATKIIAPVIWGWIADHTRHTAWLLRLASLFAVFSFAFVFEAHHFWPMVLVMVVFSFFWNASLPQVEAITLNHLHQQVNRYTHIRLWGSVGFILSVAILGWFLNKQGQVEIIPWVVLTAFTGIAMMTLLIPIKTQNLEVQKVGGIQGVLKRPEVIIFFLVCLLLQASHGPYYTFYSLYLESYEYSKLQLGLLWAIAVLAEVLVFIFMYWLVPKFGLRRIFLTSIFLTTIRWIIVAYFPHLGAVQIGSQILHAASFGTYHAVAIQYVHRFFTGRMQVRGQALYSALSFGLGGAIGSMCSGYIWEDVGRNAVYLFAASLSAFALLLAWRGIKE